MFQALTTGIILFGVIAAVTGHHWHSEEHQSSNRQYIYGQRPGKSKYGYQSSLDKQYGFNPWEYYYWRLNGQIKECESKFVCQVTTQNGLCEPVCIERNKMCDDHRDCLYGEDEIDCKANRCGPNEFTCSVYGEETCLPIAKWCDGFKHCDKNEDEQECPCGPNEFTCTVNGEKTCMSIRKWCDGYKHCDGNEDEQDCPCGPNEFTCSVNGEKTCLSIRKWCDGYKHCDGNEDELDCPCGQNEFTCSVNGRKTCLPIRKWCDGFKHCDRSEDEQECPCGTNEFTCSVNGEKTCLPIVQWCDDNQNCDGNEDEDNCPCDPLHFSCMVNGERTCFAIEQWCDNDTNCDENVDEMDCPIQCNEGQLRCSEDNTICADICNGIPECPENRFGFVEDERDPHCRLCDDTWMLVATTSNTGAVTQGSKSDLIEAALSGAEIRIQFPSLGLLTSVQNTRTIGDNLCAQALFHVSRSSYDTHANNANWEFLNACTTGQTHIKSYPVESHDEVMPGTEKLDLEVKWFIRPAMKMPLKTTSGGSVMSGAVSNLVTDVRAASDVRVVDESSGYTAPMDSLQVSSDNSLVVGQALYHVSQRPVGNNLEFQGNDYWWFTHLVSDSNFHIERWNVGEHVKRFDTSTTKAMTWYTDTCWKLAYSHDADGNAVTGSLEALRMAVLMGHRVKVLYGDDTVSVEPDEILVRGDHVNAEILRMITKSPGDITMFDASAVWDWRTLSTTGTETTRMINVGDSTERGRSTGKRPVAWYIDTRPWTNVLENTKTGTVVSGSKADLIAAINNGARVRYSVKFDNHNTAIHEADNLVINGILNEVGAQHLRSVSIGYKGGNEIEYLNNPYWFYTITSTTGRFDRSRWTVGQHTARGHNSIQHNMCWFVNY